MPPLGSPSLRSPAPPLLHLAGAPPISLRVEARTPPKPRKQRDVGQDSSPWTGAGGPLPNPAAWASTVHSYTLHRKGSWKMPGTEAVGGRPSSLHLLPERAAGAAGMMEAPTHCVSLWLSQQGSEAASLPAVVHGETSQLPSSGSHTSSETNPAGWAQAEGVVSFPRTNPGPWCSG